MRVSMLRSVVVTVAMVAAVAACGGGSNNITGTLTEWTVKTDATTAKAGEVIFTVTNAGGIGHEFLVVKTDIAAGQIPLDGDHFAEPTDGLEVIDEIGEYAAGTTETLTLNLEPGTYQLVCNLPDHYSAGMHTTFTVVP